MRSGGGSRWGQAKKRWERHTAPPPSPSANDMGMRKGEGEGDGVMPSSRCNLDRFLESTCPAVVPQYLPKSCHWSACHKKLEQGEADDGNLPYFVLGNLWDFFNEWSAYGAGVPITLNGKETVVQYYVPYLSAMQLYTPSGKKPLSKPRHPGEESDISDTGSRDSCSESSSDSEPKRVSECLKCDCGQVLRRELESCQLCDIFWHEKQKTICRFHIEDKVKRESGREWRGDLMFEYFEDVAPHGREPFTDKIADLAQRFPELRYLRSVDLLPASWMSIAWYPIYRIPTGPTLRDLQACFLTYHCLSTSLQDGAPSGIMEPTQSPMACSISLSCEDVPRINLQAFGLAHYKLRGSIWTSVGNPERRHAASLFKCAESWLRCLDVQHPDFEFFRTHY